ncbi:MAG: hypothetical protein D8M59_01270 [Planctomycetes bacterium]|nr:hypothetical protein [Planctomycetota bacterium]
MRSRILIAGLLVPAMMALSWPSNAQMSDRATGMRGRVTRRTRLPDKSQDNTKLWVHGAIHAPDKVAGLGAAGARGIIDLRKVKNADEVITRLEEYRQLGIGVCITVRWQSQDGTHHLDTPPTEEESDHAVATLMTALTSEPAKALAGKLWVQFYNELTAASRIDPKDADAMFEFATRATLQIRKDAPFVKICGPALTVSQLQYKDPNRLRARQRERYNLRQRIIEWTAKYADAADVHAHVDGPAAATEAIRSLRALLDERDNGPNVKIVAMEWSAARYPDRTDTAGAQKAVKDVWAAIQAEGVTIGAYGSLYPALTSGEAFQWQSICKSDGKPNEPFFTTLSELAASGGENAATNDKVQKKARGSARRLTRARRVSRQSSAKRRGSGLRGRTSR